MAEDISRLFGLDSDVIEEHYNFQNRLNPEQTHISYLHNDIPEITIPNDLIPLKPSLFGKNSSFSLLKPDKPTDLLILVEFKIHKDHLYALREIDEAFLQADFTFELNGYVHGRRIFSDAEVVQVSGRHML